MQPSSLIFLVLIAIWAAYLLQHWVRRREHLATARSVDRFSAAMRVLERRSSPSGLDLSVPSPRSYAHSPARPSPREVVVKRAQSPSPQDPTGTPVAVRPTRIFHLLAGVSARRVRGVSLLAVLSLLLVVSPLAALSVLPWWSLSVVVAVLVADVSWLRHVALSERAIRRAPGEAGEAGEPDSGRPRPTARDTLYFGDQSAPMFEPDSESGDECRDEHLADSGDDRAAESDSEPGSDPRSGAEPVFVDSFDTLVMAKPQLWSQPERWIDADVDPLAEPKLESGSGIESGAGTEIGAELDSQSADEAPTPPAWLAEPTVSFAQADLSSWDPVPVPPPTYTLKAKAAEPVVQPTVVTEPAATGPWSLEGLVYDCELDDLVERRSATGA